VGWRQTGIREWFVNGSWLIILAGWPLVLVAVVLIVGGLIWHKSAWVWSASVVALPMSLYLAATPLFGYLGLALPVMLVASGFAIRRNAQMLAWMLVLPYLAIMAWLAVAVLSQQTGYG
jgi:hypothetical protein